MFNARVVLIASLLIFCGTSLSSNAAQVTINVQDKKGNPLTNIVVLVRGDTETYMTKEMPAEAIMDQINREFVPHTLVVQKGMHVKFPNSDSVQHHVYSFSPAKTFELKLYSELEVEPFLFDQAGVVELGCNVHDWMLGYIYVADTPYFAQTNVQGAVSIDIPAGDYELSLWHPRLADEDIQRTQKIQITSKDLMITQALLAPLLPSLVEYDAVEGFNNYD